MSDAAAVSESLSFRLRPQCNDDDDSCPNYCSVYYGNWSIAEKRQLMIEHIRNDTFYYNGTMAAWDVVNEAICDCTPMTFATCADYMAGSSVASSKCGYSELYGVYLKKNVYWSVRKCHARVCLPLFFVC